MVDLGYRHLAGAYISVSSAPAEEPVTVADIKEDLRIDGADLDDQISAAIKAARQDVEDTARFYPVLQTHVLSLFGFPINSLEPIILPTGPFAAITSVGYQDTDNAAQTMSSSLYTTFTSATATFLTPVYQQEWPSALYTRNIPSVTITYTVGEALNTGETTAYSWVREAVMLKARMLVDELSELQMMRVERRYQALIAARSERRVYQDFPIPVYR